MVSLVFFTQQHEALACSLELLYWMEDLVRQMHHLKKKKGKYNQFCNWPPYKTPSVKT